MRSHESTKALNMTLQSCSESAVVSAPVSTLPSEAQCIFTAMFRAEAPVEVITRYNSAQRGDLLNGAWIDIDTIIKKRLDIEAIEFASRSRRTMLSQKMHIMCYVAEQSPALLSEFINGRSCRVRAFVELGLAGISSAWKLIYGTYLIKRFKLLSRDRRD
jgi:hypothetical protein